MALLLAPTFGNPEVWRRVITGAMPDLEVRLWPEVGNAADVEAAAIGTLPRGALAKLPNLRLILSLTAGIDGMLGDPDLPNVPIVRTSDANGDRMMNETVLLHVLRHHRYMPEYVRAQQRCEWHRLPILPATERKVGVMGLGMIGLAAAKTLAAAGFLVAGWVRQPRAGNGI
jgi:glyoxylate/hydroxypyruvate reductase